jgi:hypothetical protein
MDRTLARRLFGSIWIADAVLEWLPGTAASFAGLLRGAGQGAPLPLRALIHLGGALFLPHPLLWNDLLGAAELLIGLGIFLGRPLKAALTASLLLSAAIWIFGQGLGNPAPLFSGQATDLNSMPLYLIISLLLWPKPLLRAGSARILLAALWLTSAGLLWQPAVHNGLRQLVLANASGQPGALAALISWGGRQLPLGPLGAGGLSLLLAALATLLLGNWAPRATLWFSAALCGLIWLFGQGLGGIPTGTATDPNSMPLYLLLTWMVLLPRAPELSARGQGASTSGDPESRAGTLPARSAPHIGVG